MRDRGWSVLISFALASSALAMGSQETGPLQGTVRPTTEASVNRPVSGQVSGSVSFDLYRGYLIVARGSVGPLRDLTFLVDTGASPTVLDPRIARKLHLEESPASIAVLGGKVQAEMATAPSLNFGPLQANNVSVLIEDLAFLQKALPIRVDGVIGLDVLGQGAFLIDYESRQIHFGTFPALPYSIPMRVTQGLATVDVMVNDVPAHLLVDTGASSLILFARSTPGAVSTLTISAQRSSANIGDFERKQVSLHSVRLGKAEFRQEPAFVVLDGNHTGQALDGLMSPAALGITRVAIDVGRGELAFGR